MFDKTHLIAIKNTLEDQIPDILNEKANALEKAYKELDVIKDASVKVVNDKVQITIELIFEPKDEEQNIPAVIEYGGIIYDTEDNTRNIEPSYLIRRFFADGVT